MNFLPSNPKTKKIILTGGVVGAALIAFIFFLSIIILRRILPIYLMAISRLKAGVSEGLVEKIGKNISDLREELQNDFYKGLRKHGWMPDNAKAGRKNPFLKQ